MSVDLFHRRAGQGTPIVILHGLFGSSDNWASIGRELEKDHDVLLVDQRDHGRSPHTNEVNYGLMADDVQRLVTGLGLKDIVLVGHSMGGKTAMWFAHRWPGLVKHLVGVDMGPREYPISNQAPIIEALLTSDLDRKTSRKEVDEHLARYVPEPGVRQFLLKSFAKGESGWGWRFNVPALERNYANIMGWPDDERRFEGATLVIKGGDSDYMLPEYTGAAMAQFPAAKARVIAGTGHWLHAEKPVLFNKLVVDFLSTGG